MAKLMHFNSSMSWSICFRILETKSITKFLELFSENVAEFTPNVISFSAKTITSLLDQTRGAIME